jgi:tetratricopeptide (TPR) repeat protein
MPASEQKSVEAALRAVGAALRVGDKKRAISIAAKACADGIEHFALLTLAAQGELAAGQPDRAIVLALKARDLNARNCEVLNTLGIAYAAAGKAREALAVFDHALREFPQAWDVRYNKATALEELQEFAPARAEFERVLEVEPQHAGAMARLASLAMLRGDIVEGRRRADEALRVDPSDRWTELTLAAADIEDRLFDVARARIARRDFDADPDLKRRSVAQSLMGDALDGLDRTGEAFGCYLRARGSALALADSQLSDAGRESGAKLIARLTNYFEHARTDDWRAPKPSASSKRSPAHAFIVGFPRSGTTLLGQVLAAHLGVEVMDERNCLRSAQERFTIPPDGIGRLAVLDDSDLAFWRDDYWKNVAAEGFKAKCPVFVDKMPFYCVFLCLIAKLFPGAKILFLIRDPRDVVLSCLRKPFVMTTQMRELSSLDAAAAHYDAVMSLCEVYRRTLDLQICDVRHEDLVGQFDAETQRICAFLDLKWQPGLRDFAQSAAQHSIGTPSGAQLARGLLTDRHGQWRRYREQLEPALPRLKPWIERFGYEGD